MQTQTLQNLYLQLEHLNHWTKLTQKTTLQIIKQKKQKPEPATKKPKLKVT